MYFENSSYMGNKKVLSWLMETGLLEEKYNFFVEYYDYTLDDGKILQSDIWSLNTLLEEVSRENPEVQISYIEPSEAEF